MLILLTVGCLFLVILLGVGVFISVRSERTQLERRLGRYMQDEAAATERKEERSVVIEWVEKRVRKSSLGENIARQLARADLKLKVGEYLTLIVVSALGVGLLFWLLSGAGLHLRGLISAMGGAVVGFFLPQFYVHSQQANRLRRFNDQLPDMLNLMVNGLRAGYSTLQALEAVSREMPPPISDEFRRVVQEIQLGVPIEKALENLYRRIPSDDLDFVITAINVQREVGGNLSEILETISFTIRERIRIKGEIRVLTAQVRTSGTIMALIPVFLTVFLWFLNPDYMNSFFLRGLVCGLAALGLAAALVIIGYMIMMRIANIEV